VPEGAVSGAIGRYIAKGVRVADITGDVLQHRDLIGVIRLKRLASAHLSNSLEEPRIRVVVLDTTRS
jgi:hypothetical protein